MQKYKVELVQTETFIVDVLAENEKEAIEMAKVQFNNGNYQEVGDCTIDEGTVYNVTETDDPFNP